MDDFISFIKEKHGEETWISLYKNITSENRSEDGGFFCGLVVKEKTADAMTKHGWDLMRGDGRPGFSESYSNGKSIATYLSGKDSDFRPLVICRDFEGRKEDYLEFSEEFRLFHNLYFDNTNSKYIAFDDTGEEIEVIKFLTNEVKVRRSYLRSFLAAIQMDLLLYFELTRHFKEKVHIEDEDRRVKHGTAELCFTKYSGDSYAKGYSSFVRILGKKLIKCGAIETCGVWPFEKERVYEEFIIGGDSDELIKFICKPDMLANYFGANPDSPHYLTPVFFRKEVMQKYYNSSGYEIQDSYLRRKGAWGLRFDNNSPTHISVFLGDLGQDLPNKEQIYWKSYNIIPDGHKISEPNFQRSFLGNFFNSTNPEFRFKYKFENLQKYWDEKFGWTIFLPLKEKDSHFYQSIRSLLTNEQAEFDTQILALAKVTMDSINIKELKSFLSCTDEKITPIGLLQLLLEHVNVDDITSKIDFLRGVQSIRSTGVAHRKGSDYEKTIKKLKIDADNYMSEFDEILIKFSEILSDMSCVKDKG
ncbi:hypothetical protein [Methylosoma difficile]